MWKKQRGFTLTELVVVIAIIGTLSGLVAGAVRGLGATGNLARLEGDRTTIAKSADRFFTDSFPQIYPVVDLDDTDPFIVTATDLGVRLIDFEATLPQDPAVSFSTNFLKEIPDSAALVSWRVTVDTGNVFFAKDGAVLAKPSTARLDVSAANRTPDVTSDYTFKIRMRVQESASQIVRIAIPAGYIIGGQALPADTVVGNLKITVLADNPWDTGEEITITGTVKTTVVDNEWKIDVDYDTNLSTGPFNDINVKDTNGPDVRVHTLRVVPPSAEHKVPGKLILNSDRTNETGGVVTYRDPDINEATEIWELTVLGSVLGDVIIKNPPTAAVYRWLGDEQTAIDIAEFFDSMPGNQAVIVK